MLVLILKLCVSVFRSIIKPEVLFSRLEVLNWPGLKFVIRVSSVLGPPMWQWASADGNCWAEEEQEEDTPLCNIVSAPSTGAHLSLVTHPHSTIILSLSLASPVSVTGHDWRHFYSPNFYWVSPNLYLFASVPDFPRLCFYFIELR